MDSISDDEKFGVEKILDQRKRKGVLEYLVSWKGESLDTWEPAKNIAADCALAVKNFVESQRSRQKSKSRSKSRSRSRGRKATGTRARKSSRSRSKGRQTKVDSATTSLEKQEVAVRRSARQQKAAEVPDLKKQVEEVKVIPTEVNTVSTNTSNTIVMTAKTQTEENSGRVLRSSTMEQPQKREVQRVHNDQRPVREDDSKPRSPVWKVADYIVIVLFVVSLLAAVFLFVEKFVNLGNFKKQFFPNLEVLRNRLNRATTQLEDFARAIFAYISDAWLHFVDYIKLPRGSSSVAQEKAAPK